MRKIFSLIFVSLFLFVLMLSIGSSFMPKNTHKFIWDQALKYPVDSETYKACVKYPNLCYSGQVLADVSVVFYWLNGGVKYDVTHSPVFCRGVMEAVTDDKSLACAVGICGHSPIDIVSHNEMVPYSIKHSFLVNNIIHMFAEQKVDNWVEKNDPDIKGKILNYMADYEQCIPIMKKVMLGTNEYSDITEKDLDEVIDKFMVEIQTSQTGYDTAFKSKSFMVNLKALPFSIIAIYTLLMLFWLFITILLTIKIFRKQAKLRHYIAIFIFGFLFIIMAYVFIANLQGKAFQAIVTVIKPISEIVPIGNTPQYYIDKAVKNSREFMQEGPTWLQEQAETNNNIAHGRYNLNAADRSILTADYIILIGLVILLGFYLWFLFRKNKVTTNIYGNI